MDQKYTEMNKRLNKSRPIYVLGLPRSGSTWVSKAISMGAERRIVHEPFNWLRYPERIKYHMKYLRADANDQDLINILVQASKPTIPFTDFLIRNSGILIKDVHICLAVEYISKIFNPHIVILIRHPCAMAQSWKRMNLEIPFRIETLLSQDSLVKDFLEPFSKHLKSRDDYFFSFGGYWGASYYVMWKLTQQHPEWVWANHDDLCINPIEKFSSLLQNLGIQPTNRGYNRLDKFLSKNNAVQRKKDGPHSVRRLTNEEPDKWKEILRPDDIKAIFDGAAPFENLLSFFKYNR